jgi:hypothetical protein
VGGERSARLEPGAAQLLPRRHLALVFAAAAAIRVAYWVAVTPRWVPVSDAHQYVLLARSLARGEGFALAYPQLEFHAAAFRPPLYPVTLTPAFLLSDGLWAARMTSVALGAAAAVLAALVACRIGGRAAGLSAGALVAVCPPLLANDTVTLTEPLASVLLLAIVLCVDRGRHVLAGGLAGALLLTRPNGYLVAALVVAATLWRSGWRRAALSAAAVVLVVLPWSIRNQVQVGTPRLVTSDAFTLAAVYAPAAQQARGFVDPVFDPRYDGDTELRLAQFDEARWSEVLLERAVQGIRRNPRYVAQNAARNALLVAELRPAANEPAEVLDGRDLGFRRATRPSFYAVAAVGLVGMWRYRRHPTARFVTLVAAQFLLLCVAFVAAPRLRAPFDLACCVMSGAVVAESVRRVSRTGAHPGGTIG